MNPNNVQIGGDHYFHDKIQFWDWMEENNFGYVQGLALNYIYRAERKNGIEDIRKAKHCLEKQLTLTRMVISEDLKIVEQINSPRFQTLFKMVVQGSFQTAISYINGLIGKGLV